MHLVASCIPLSEDLQFDGMPLEDPGQRSGLAVNAEDSLVVVLRVVGVLDCAAAVLRWVVLEGGAHSGWYSRTLTSTIQRPKR